MFKDIVRNVLFYKNMVHSDEVFMFSWASLRYVYNFTVICAPVCFIYYLS